MLAIMGSGETAPTMAKVHRALFERFEAGAAPVPAATRTGRGGSTVTSSPRAPRSRTPVSAGSSAIMTSMRSIRANWQA